MSAEQAELLARVTALADERDRLRAELVTALVRIGELELERRRSFGARVLRLLGVRS